MITYRILDMSFYTADLCDANASEVRTTKPVFLVFGERLTFGGPIRTLRVYEDNSLVKDALSSAGDGAVLVVDGGASTRCALLGGNLAELASVNGWAGLIINGCIRDTHEINACNIGVRALGTCPRKSEKRGEGDRDVVLSFAGAEFRPGEHVYCDQDGVIVAARNLLSA
jgi:regulator of ribonuclease activity A